MKSQTTYLSFVLQFVSPPVGLSIRNFVPSCSYSFVSPHSFPCAFFTSILSFIYLIVGSFDLCLPLSSPFLIFLFVFLPSLNSFPRLFNKNQGMDERKHTNSKTGTRELKGGHTKNDRTMIEPNQAIKHTNQRGNTVDVHVIMIDKGIDSTSVVNTALTILTRRSFLFIDI